MREEFIEEFPTGLSVPIWGKMSTKFDIDAAQIAQAKDLLKGAGYVVYPE